MLLISAFPVLEVILGCRLPKLLHVDKVVCLDFVLTSFDHFKPLYNACVYVNVYNIYNLNIIYLYLFMNYATCDLSTLPSLAMKGRATRSPACTIRVVPSF